MPNYVYNKIEFNGEEAPLNALKEKMKGIITNNSRQIMGDLLGKNSWGKDWYNHNRSNYGTKWDVSVEDCFTLEINEENVILEFETAWSLPFIFIEETCKKYNVSANAIYDSINGYYAGILKVNNKGEIIESNEWQYEEGIYHIYPQSFLKDIESNIDDYIDKTWQKTQDLLNFVSPDDLYRIKNVFDKRSDERLFDNPPLGQCLNKNSYNDTLSCITFKGNLDKLICKLTEIEHNESDQVMTNILGFDSFKSKWIRRRILGSKDDFSIHECRINMNDDLVAINHFTKSLTPPLEFLKHACIQYDVTGEMIIDGDHYIDSSIAKANSKGDLTIELRSIAPGHDPDDFFCDIGAR